MSNFPPDPPTSGQWNQPPPPPPQPSYQDPTTVQPQYQQPPTYQQPAYQPPVPPTPPAYAPQAPAGPPPSGGKASKGGTILVGLVALAVGIGGGYLLGSQTGGSDVDDDAIVELTSANEDLAEELADATAEIAELEAELASGGGSADDDESQTSDDEEPADEEDEEAADDEPADDDSPASVEAAITAYCDAVDAFVDAGVTDIAAAQELSQRALDLPFTGMSPAQAQQVADCTERLNELVPGG